MYGDSKTINQVVVPSDVLEQVTTAYKQGSELYFVAKGNGSDGHDYTGPFPTFATAADWAEVNHETAPWHVAAMRTPFKF